MGYFRRDISGRGDSQHEEPQKRERAWVYFRKGTVSWGCICRDLSTVTLSGDHEKFQTLTPCTDLQYNDASSLGRKKSDLMIFVFLFLPPSVPPSFPLLFFLPFFISVSSHVSYDDLHLAM